MVVLSLTFLVNLLCAIVPCDPVQPLPELDLTSTSPPEYPVVETKGGFLKGFTMDSIQGRKIHAFEGIPYAEPPIGFFRFRSTVPKRPWTGVLDAFKPGPNCLQIHLAKAMRVTGNEDCLYLNVYVPQEAQKMNDSLAVILFFHGGSFIFGAGSEFGPSYLSQKDLILVTFNYRLGVLGFLSTGDAASYGNWGLKDQILAMEWTYENIGNFGGDPTRITILGQSAGSVSTSLHYFSQRSRPFFSGGISMSGSAFVHWGLQEKKNAKKLSKKLAHVLRCPTTNSFAMVDCLRNGNPALVVAAQIHLFEWIPFPPVLFAPVLEEEHEDAFISQRPEILYEKNKVANYSFIAGLCSQEGYAALYFLKGFQKYSTFEGNIGKYLPNVLDYSYLGGDVEGKTESILSSFHLNDSFIPDGPLAEMASYRYFLPGILNKVKFHSRLAPTYAFIFSYMSQYNLGKNFGVQESEWGVGHGEDMFFLFNSSLFSVGFRRRDPEYTMSQIMINVIYNYASRRIPLYTDENGVSHHIWDRIESPNELKFLQFNHDTKMIPDPFKQNLKMWEGFGFSDMKPFKEINENIT